MLMLNLVRKPSIQSRGGEDVSVGKRGLTLIQKMWESVLDNKSLAIKTFMLILAVVGVLMATERRITLLEAHQATDHEQRLAHERVLMDMVKSLQSEMTEMQKQNVRVATLLDQIDKRHQIEDIKKAR